MHDRMELVDAAAALRLPYYKAHDMALTGRLEAQRENGRWFVTRESVDRLVQERSQEPQPVA